MQAQKDVMGYFAELAPLQPKILVIPNAGGRPYYPPSDMVKIAKGLGLEVEAQTNLEAALNHIWTINAKSLLVGGSLFLAGDMLAQLGHHVQ